MSNQTQRLIGVAILTASLPAVAPADVILEYDTGHPLGPHFLTVDEETPLQISVTDRTGEQWGVGGVLFGFIAPSGGLTWDLNGPDNIDFSEDDDFTWPCYFFYPCSFDYFANVDPAGTGFVGFSSKQAVQVPANGTVLLATLTLGPTELGDSTLKVDDIEKAVILDASTFVEMIIEDSTGQVTLTVIPRGDADGDADVDLIDFGIFQACFTGSGTSDVQGVCTLFDFDSDDDVDLDDFAEFLDAVTGPYA